MLQLLKKNFLALIVIVEVVKEIILASYVWDEKPIIKMLILGSGLMSLTLLLLYSKFNKNVISSTKPQAVLCSFCGLFVPLDVINNSGQPKPHCCFIKPK